QRDELPLSRGAGGILRPSELARAGHQEQAGQRYRGDRPPRNAAAPADRGGRHHGDLSAHAQGGSSARDGANGPSRKPLYRVVLDRQRQGPNALHPAPQRAARAVGDAPVQQRALEAVRAPDAVDGRGLPRYAQPPALRGARRNRRPKPRGSRGGRGLTMAKKKPLSGYRDDSGKLPWHLLPYDAVEDIVRVLHHGATKYAPRNWERGMAWSRCSNSLTRHLVAYMQG